ncbi:phage/plasmid primase, P4 family [Pseudonocardia sp. WMMC193]|uniref:phage/plasmid primase, P4 family n=1 Tax=Pseudonocardia sp. WMMC193 TaxID=2911965 RepID=UPI001F003D2D|nr:phage/plasmid primase, P4 family [Pseudonocardia sp. WMMC193]MCF7548170.1 phage/plasmid primase, P4 family [Pseudonocardia sp. WMMC193]
MLIDISADAYANSYEDYYNSGFEAIPLHRWNSKNDEGDPTGKDPILSGRHGFNHTPLTLDELREWVKRPRNIGWVLPEDIIALDFDAYDGKNPEQVLADLEAELGPLPQTAYQSNRGPRSFSRHRFFEVPEDSGAFNRSPGKNSGIDMVSASLRYVTAAPSRHPDHTDEVPRIYQFYSPAGDVIPVSQVRRHIAPLPAAWVQWFQERNAGRSPDKRADLTTEESSVALTQFSTSGEPCKAVRAVVDDVGDDIGHDVAGALAMRALRLGEQGHAGVAHALTVIRNVYETSRGHKRDTDEDFDRLVNYAVPKIVGKPTEGDRNGCNGSGGCGVRKPPAPTALGWSDAEVADRLADMLRGRFCFTPALGWMSYDSTRWVEVSDDHIAEALRCLVLEKCEELSKTTRDDPDAERELDGWFSLKTRRRRETVIKDVRAALLVDTERFDADPDVLNTPDGLVDLRTGSVEPHSPHHWITKVTLGSYVPGMSAVMWDTLLTAVDPAERTYLRNRFGQAATGYQPTDDALLILCGSGSNGKSQIITGVMNALGDYACAVEHSVFSGDRGSGSSDIAELRGARLAVAEELAEGRSLNSTSLKRMLGTGRIKAAKKYRDAIEFNPTHSLVTTSNYMPVVAETDDGTWRRLQMVWFPYQYVTSDRELRIGERRGDSGIKRKVERLSTANADAIVTWLVEGALAWYADPDGSIAPTEQVAAKNEEWRQTSDKIMGFWKSGVVELHEGSVIATEDLHAAFNDWMREQGHAPWVQNSFLQRFSAHYLSRGVEKRRVRLTEVTRSSRRFSKPSGDQVSGFVGMRFTADSLAA